MLLFGLLAGSASAASSHHYAGSFSTGEDPIYPFGACNVHDLDVDAQENVYVLCGGQPFTSGASGAVVKKFDKNGNPISFTASAPYLSGNTIVENPDPNGAYREDLGRTFGGEGKIAVDSTNTSTSGYIYVLVGDRVDVFKPSGKFVSALAAAGAFGITSVGTDAEGNVYYNTGFKIDKRDASLSVVGQLYAVKSNSEFSIRPASTDLAFDSEGNVWGVGNAEPGFGEQTISRWEANQFGPPEQESEFSLGTHKKAKLSSLAEAPLRAFGSADELEAESITVDRSDNSLFAENVNPRQILQFSGGSATEPAHQIAAPIGDESNVGSSYPWYAAGIAIGNAGTIFAGAGEKEVSLFASGSPLPTVIDHPVATADVGHTDVTVRAELKLSGGTPISGCEVEYGTSRAYNHTALCTPDPSGTPFNADTTVSAHLTGLTTGAEYHFAFVATNAAGSGYGIDRTFSPAGVLGLTTQPPTEVTDHSATFNGTLDPDGMSTTYYFEYGLEGELTASTDESAPISGSGTRSIAVPVDNLGTGKEYQYRFVATNSLGTTRGPVQTFSVAGPPAVTGVRAAGVRSTEANLEAKVNPGGYQTTYRFEYGTTKANGSSVPAPPAEGEAGAGAEFVALANHIAGLEPGRTYHFRLVATNHWGTTVSDDTTFNFTPQECPNEHVRQQMKSSYLPDCRAYELVSPENAGGAQIYPGNEAYIAGAVGFPAFYGAAYAREIQNTGLATSPSRFAFYVGLGAIGGLDAPNMMLDQYTSTRSNTGWVTSFSGIHGSEAGGTGHKVCSTTLSMCLDHTLTNPFVDGTNPRNWGYLFNAEGEKQGIAPTNVDAVANGREYVGDWRPSPDFTHLAFSSRNVPFTADSTPVQSGWAYDDNLQTGAVTLISTLPNGEPIPTEGEFITIPPTGVSGDGSHILMETRAPERELPDHSHVEGQHYLYLSVDDSRTYEIGAPGEGPAEGIFIGMSSNGTKVLFLSEERLLPEDTDNGADIYMWEENGGVPALKLISQGAGQGDSDTCKASWNGAEPGEKGCSVMLLETVNGDRPAAKQPTEAGLDYTEVTLTGTDSRLASSSGGVLFFSPETLAGAAPRNGKNLYLANDGEVQYVATLGAKQTIDRIQISPDGKHAGLLTRARLTPYDNEGFEEMYSYNAITGRLNCVSCIPDGEKPTADVEASQNGPFMSNDGRLFFSTSDPLVPTDSDPFRIPDIYEYTEGRPQLISSGTSSDGKAAGGAGAFVSETLGLESVSSNGQDVFFSTTDSLVPQDANGHFVKIYDARTNGGFEVPAQPAPCVAADECHGNGAATPPPLAVGTGSTTTGGNVSPEPQTKKKTCKAKGKGKGKHRCAANGKKSKKKKSARRQGGTQR